jgi:hypothetical protein
MDLRLCVLFTPILLNSSVLVLVTDDRSGALSSKDF